MCEQPKCYDWCAKCGVCTQRHMFGLQASSIRFIHNSAVMIFASCDDGRMPSAPGCNSASSIVSRCSSLPSVIDCTLASSMLSRVSSIAFDNAGTASSRISGRKPELTESSLNPCRPKQRNVQCVGCCCSQPRAQNQHASGWYVPTNAALTHTLPTVLLRLLPATPTPPGHHRKLAPVYIKQYTVDGSPC